jgi:succinate dehydrogenase/fumarate reductase cytochrome b subunit
MTLAKSANGNPVITTVVIILFYLFFNILEAIIEKLIFGERFEHWLDPIFVAGFIAYAAYAVMTCAVFNSERA